MKQVVRKVYRLISCHSMAVNLNVKGKPGFMVVFSGGSRSSNIKGFYISDNPSVQEALEKSSLFNRDFYLERVEKFSISDPAVPRTVISETVVSNEKNNDPVNENNENKESGKDMIEVNRPQSLQNVEDVTNLSAAKMYLMTNFSDEKDKIVPLRSPDEIREYARQKGLSFPNCSWK